MDYIIPKALHIIGVVSWFAGLFYIVRLYIYHAEASVEAEPKRTLLIEQYKVMERRLWRAITQPAMVLTLITGAWLVKFYPLGQNPWLIFKLCLLVPLFAYHLHCGWIRKTLLADRIPFTSRQLRIYNEIPTFLLVGIVFTVVSKTVSTGLWSLVGCCVFFALAVGLLLKSLQGKS